MELHVTKLQVGLAKTMGKAGEVARFFDESPRLPSLLARNLWAVAHAAAHVLFRCSTRLAEDLSVLPDDEALPLFDVPEDHAMTVREIEAWLDSFKGSLLRGALAVEKEENNQTLAHRVKAFIADWVDNSEEPCPSWAVVDEFPEVVLPTIYALHHAGELEESITVKEAWFANAGDLSVDIAAMLILQPGLGTPAGLGEGETVKMLFSPGEDDPPLDVDAVSVRIYAGDGATFDQLAEEFEPKELARALAWLVEQGKVDTVVVEDGTIFFVPFGQDVSSLHGDTLRAVYERETGQKAGRKGEERLRREIRDARQAHAAKDIAADQDEEEEGADE